MTTPGTDTRTSSAQNPLGDWLRNHKDLLPIIAFIAFLHVLGWGTLITIASTEHLQIGTTAFGIGLGLTAYLLGVRHAFDADHIAAIDNTTRKLMQEGKKSASVGFWFSCGHSTIVFALTLIIAVGVRAVVGPVMDDNSQLHAITGLIGTLASSGFLYAIAALNLVVLIEVWKAFRQRHTGDYDQAALDKHLNNRGLMSRLLGRIMKLVTQPWQMYLVGLLFGLGFDTATEIALLVLTSTGAASGVPWYAILCLPVLFAAGMTLFDTLDGSLMTAAYGWALTNPDRTLYYNLVVTSLSIIVALVIGTIEIAGLLSERLNLQGAIWVWLSELDLSRVGMAIVGIFFATWMSAVLFSKFGRAARS
jgi:nickel/cobalt transporter (NiCoT) family protein